MKKFRALLILTIAAVMLAACSDKESSSDQTASKGEYPNKTLNVIIPFGPGGGTDLYLRKIMEIMQKEKIYTENVKIENREGGSGAVGWGFLQSKKGDAYYVAPTSGSFFTTPLVSNTNFNYETFTPIALMGADDLLLLVKEESEFNELDSFIDAAKNGKRMKIGGVGQVSDEMIIPHAFAQEAGFEFDYVPFQSAGELTSALLSDSLDAIVGNPARSLGQINGDLMKALAFSGLERLPQLDEVPTFIELGFDVNLSQPRGVILAEDVDADVKEWWINAMKQVAETKEWKDFITENGMSEYILFGDEFGTFLEETSNKFEESLDDLEE